MAGQGATGDLTPGIPDPLTPDRWLVCPWPVEAGFCDVVRHFLTTYVGRLQGERSVARQLAYFEAYQAALKEAATDGLTDAAAWHWHDDMVACVDDCVAVFQEKAATENLSATGPVPRLRPNAPTTIPIRRRQKPSHEPRHP